MVIKRIYGIVPMFIIQYSLFYQAGLSIGFLVAILYVKENSLPLLEIL